MSAPMIFAGDNEVTRRPAGADDLSKLILAIVAIGGADPEPGLGPVETATKADIDDAGDSVRAINCRGDVGEDFGTVDRERGTHRDVGERTRRPAERGERDQDKGQRRTGPPAAAVAVG